MGMMSAG